jgi:hypothetical protein
VINVVVVVVVVFTEVVVLDAGLDGDGTDDWRRADEEKDETQVLPYEYELDGVSQS